MSLTNAAGVGSRGQSPLRFRFQTEVEGRAGCQCRETTVRLQVKEKLAQGPAKGSPQGQRGDPSPLVSPLGFKGTHAVWVTLAVCFCSPVTVLLGLMLGQFLNSKHHGH